MTNLFQTLLLLLILSPIIQANTQKQQALEDLATLLDIPIEKVNKDFTSALSFLDGNKQFIDMNFHFNFPHNLLDKYERKTLLIRRLQIMSDNLSKLNYLAKANETFFYEKNPRNQLNILQEMIKALKSIITKIETDQNSSLNLKLLSQTLDATTKSDIQSISDLPYLLDLKTILTDLETKVLDLQNNETISLNQRVLKFSQVGISFEKNYDHPGDGFITIQPKDPESPQFNSYAHFQIPIFHFNERDFTHLMSSLFPNLGPYRIAHLKDFGIDLSYGQIKEMVHILEDLAQIHNQTGKLHLK